MLELSYQNGDVSIDRYWWRDLSVIIIFLSNPVLIKTEIELFQIKLLIIIHV